MDERAAKVFASLPNLLFFEECFVREGRKIAEAKLSLCMDDVEHGNMMKCSPLLTKDQETLLFRQFNYFRYKIVSVAGGDEWRRLMSDKESMRKRVGRLGARKLGEIESLVRSCEGVRNAILKANMRLMVRPVSKHASRPGHLKDELISDSCMFMIRAIERFDYRRGVKFSTYCVNTIQNNLYWYRAEAAVKQKRFEDIHDIDRNLEARPETREAMNASEFLGRAMKVVKGGHRRIIKGFFGIDCKKARIKDLAKELGVSRDTVQKMKDQALRRMSSVAYDPLV